MSNRKKFDRITDGPFEGYEARTVMVSIASLRMDVVVVPKDERTFYHVYSLVGHETHPLSREFDTFAEAKDFFNEIV